jgi:hypothetical protein
VEPFALPLFCCDLLVAVQVHKLDVVFHVPSLWFHTVSVEFFTDE